MLHKEASNRHLANTLAEEDIDLKSLNGGVAGGGGGVGVDGVAEYIMVI